MAKELMKTNLCSITKRDDVATPTYLYETLDNIYKFDFDPCPFLAAEKNGLTTNWGKMNYVNPPYSNIKPWVKKAILELARGNKTVMLVPVRTSARYWQDLVFPFADDILFLDKTIVFDSYKNSCPFPLALLEFLTPGIKRKYTKIETSHIVRKRTRGVVKFFRYGTTSRSQRLETPRRGSLQNSRREKKGVDQSLQRNDGDDASSAQGTQWNILSPGEGHLYGEFGTYKEETTRLRNSDGQFGAKPDRNEQKPRQVLRATI